MTVTDTPPQASPSSRTSERDAGWRCSEPGSFRALEPPGPPPKFSWMRPSILWSARNDPLARYLGDPTDEHRKGWIAGQRARGVTGDFAIDRSDLGESFSCLIAGDTGEGTHPQFAVVPGLLEVGRDTSFLVVMSDVIYPIGNVNEYLDKFYRPYSAYPAPIYAVPGNHDWYDGLGGFMRHFCGAEPSTDQRLPGRGVKAWLRDRLWRAPSVIAADTVEQCRTFRPAPGQQATLPAPYWTIETVAVRFVGIDTGIIGNIDGDQGDWLRRVSAGPKPKILVTGKPLLVSNTRDLGVVAGRDFAVDDVVRDPANNYVAAIGGDIHNYQRYPVRVGDRVIQYIVSGGGGAFMHATHTIPRVDVEGVSEDEFRCYPLRGDSLAFYSRLYSRKLAFGTRLLEISPEQASALIGSRLGIAPTRGGTARPTRATKAKGSFVGLLPSGHTFHKYISEFAESVDPPFFKNFLRLDVSPAAVRVRCFAATGCADAEREPPLEDDFTITLRA